MRTIDWVDGAVEIVDQTVLPGELRILRLHTVPELVAAIQSLAVRGAPALGVAGAFGVALAARVHADDPAALAAAVKKVETARPTAVNLARGARRAAAKLPRGPQAVLAEACAIRDEEIAASDAMAARGADLMLELCGARPRLLIAATAVTFGAATIGAGLGLGVLENVFVKDKNCTKPLEKAKYCNTSVCSTAIWATMPLSVSRQHSQELHWQNTSGT